MITSIARSYRQYWHVYGQRIDTCSKGGRPESSAVDETKEDAIEKATSPKGIPGHNRGHCSQVTPFLLMEGMTDLVGEAASAARGRCGVNNNK